MSDDVRPILVVGSVALDTVHTPTEVASEVLGGGASYFCVAGSLFAPIQLVAVVGDDFPTAHRALLESRNIDLGGLEVLKGKTFRWTARYSGIRLEQRETLDTQLNVFAGFHPALPAAYRSSRVIFLSNIQPELQLEVLDQRSEEHTSELQSHSDLVCRLLLEKKKGTATLRTPIPRLMNRCSLSRRDLPGRRASPTTRASLGVRPRRATQTSATVTQKSSLDAR